MDIFNPLMSKTDCFRNTGFVLLLSFSSVSAAATDDGALKKQINAAPVAVKSVQQQLTPSDSPPSSLHKHTGGMQDMQGKQDMKGMKNMQDMQNMQNMQDMKDMKGMKGMQDMKDMKGMQDMKDMKDMKGMQGMQDMKGMKGTKDMKGMFTRSQK